MAQNDTKMGSKEKGPPGDVSYAGRVGVHYLHRREGLKGENSKKKHGICWKMLSKVGLSAESKEQV